MDERAEAVAALRALKDEIESLIASGLTGDVEHHVDRLAEAYGPALSALFALWPTEIDDPEEDAAPGPIVTMTPRSPADAQPSASRRCKLTRKLPLEMFP